MYTTRIAGSTDKEQVFAIPAAPAAQDLHPETEAAIALILDKEVAPLELSMPAAKPSPASLITVEIKIDMESPEMQAVIKKAAEELAVVVTSIDHGCLVIEALKSTLAALDGELAGSTTRALIEAVNRRVLAMDNLVAAEREVLAAWVDRNRGKAYYGRLASYWRRHGCIAAGRTEVTMSRRLG